MMNKQMNMPALQKIMREFERQNERMEMTSEMMGDAIDDAFEVGTAPVWPASTRRRCSGSNNNLACTLHSTRRIRQ